MPENNEETFATGLSILEMIRTPGWQWLEEEILKELDMERKELLDFDLEGLGIEQIAAEYLRHRANVHAFKKVLFRVELAITDKESAAQKMRRE